MNQETYRHLISRRSPNVAGIPIRAVLTVLSWPYRLVVCLRNHLYARHRLKVHHVNAPVLCVGNLTTGGTGKTPLVAWLVHLLQQRRMSVAILTRGYKAKGGALSDEPAELAAGCPGAAVTVNPDRVAGAIEAIRHQNAQVLVMDDGFQHRRLARDVDIVTIDATLPFGHDRLLPAGLLREPISALKRAHAVVITRCDLVSSVRLLQIEARCRRVNPALVLARSVHAPISLKTAQGSEMSPQAVRGRKVFAFCGLGNPRAFFITLRRQGCHLVGRKTFGDHHHYTAGCLAGVYHEANRHHAELIVTTQKDWTKIAHLSLPEMAPPVAILAVELQFTAGREELTALIDRALGGTMPSQ